MDDMNMKDQAKAKCGCDSHSCDDSNCSCTDSDCDCKAHDEKKDETATTI